MMDIFNLYSSATNNLKSHLSTIYKGHYSSTSITGIDLIFLPVGSPHLNPIEPVWSDCVP